MTKTAVLNSTAIELITDALDILTVADANQPLSAEDQATGLRVFNQMIKLWQAQGKHLWSLTEAVVPLEKGVNSYKLGPSGANIANQSDFISTTLAADAAAAATTITLSSVAGMLGAANTLSSDPADSTTGWSGTGATITSDGDILTITNSGAASGYADYTLTTEFGVTYLVDFDYTLGTSAGATFSIEDTVDATTLATLNLTATASGQLEFTATQNSHALRFKNDSTTISETSLVNAITFKVKNSGDKIGVLLDGGTRQWSSIVSISGSVVTLNDTLTGAATTANSVYSYTNKIERPLRVLSARYQDKLSASEIPTIEWSRERYFNQTDKTTQGTVTQWYYDPQLVEGSLHVWPTPSSSDAILNITYTRPLEVNTTNADTPDFPSEWFMALSYNLAAMLGPRYGVPQPKMQEVKMMAAEYLEDVLGFDSEPVALSVAPNSWSR